MGRPRGAALITRFSPNHTLAKGETFLDPYDWCTTPDPAKGRRLRLAHTPIPSSNHAQPMVRLTLHQRIPNAGTSVTRGRALSSSQVTPRLEEGTPGGAPLPQTPLSISTRWASHSFLRCCRAMIWDDSPKGSPCGTPILGRPVVTPQGKVSPFWGPNVGLELSGLSLSSGSATVPYTCVLV